MDSRVLSKLVFFLKGVSLKFWLVAGLFVACVLLVVFFQALGLFAGILLFVLLVFFLVFAKHRLSLEEQKLLLLQENKEVEKRFLKHSIDEPAFKQIVSENEKRLIEIEASLEGRKFPERDVSQVSTKRRHKLRELSDEKSEVLAELGIAKQKYFKHKLDEATFRQVSMEKQKLLVGIDTKISELYRSEAREVMQETARKLEALKEKTEEEIAIEEVSEQVETQRAITEFSEKSAKKRKRKA